MNGCLDHDLTIPVMAGGYYGMVKRPEIILLCLKKINQMSKTHYATCDRANESDNQDYWSDTYCGLEYTESPLSDRIEYVTCKKCLQRYAKQVKIEQQEIKNFQCAQMQW